MGVQGGRPTLVGASEKAAQSHREFLSVQVSRNGWVLEVLPEERRGTLLRSLPRAPPAHPRSSAGPGSTVHGGRAWWPAPSVPCHGFVSGLLVGFFQCPGHNPPVLAS